MHCIHQMQQLQKRILPSCLQRRRVLTRTSFAWSIELLGHGDEVNNRKRQRAKVFHKHAAQR